MDLCPEQGEQGRDMVGDVVEDAGLEFSVAKDEWNHCHAYHCEHEPVQACSKIGSDNPDQGEQKQSRIRQKSTDIGLKDKVELIPPCRIVNAFWLDIPNYDRAGFPDEGRAEVQCLYII